MTSINKIHATLHRPERGWDPVSADHASKNAQEEWTNGVSLTLLDFLEEAVGGFSGKRVLDLGGGPGHYSIEFAKRGALVSWHDISSNYKRFSARKAIENSVEIDFSLGYMDEAPDKFGKNSFDLVFNRICWYYGIDDRSFAQNVYDLVAPGGVGYVDTTHSGWRRSQLTLWAKACAYLNDTYYLKIGHPTPPRGRVAHLFNQMSIESIYADYSSPSNDRVLFRK